MGGEELKWRQLAHHQYLYMSQQGAHSSGISDVAIASVYFEKTRQEDNYDNYYYEFIARTDFGGRQKLTSAMKQNQKSDG